MTKDEALLWCVDKIRARAEFMGLRWKVEDVVQADCGAEGTVVFLQRFNPQERFDERGVPILDDEGQPVHTWEVPMWLEHMDTPPGMRREGDNFIMSIPLPRLVCKCPELVFIVKPDGGIIGRGRTAWRVP